MGNYLFSTKILIDALNEGHRLGDKDFGSHVIPRLCKTHRVLAYDFSTNRIPGVRDYEEQGYWRDVGTIDAYFQAHQDLLGLEPRFNLFNPHWCIGSKGYQGPSAKFIHTEIDNSIVSAGSFIKGARIHNSIIRREVLIEEDVELDECIVMDYTVIRRGARLKRAIIDRYNVIKAGRHIGYNRDADAKSYFMSDSGIVIVPKLPHDGGPPRYL